MSQPVRLEKADLELEEVIREIEERPDDERPAWVEEEICDLTNVRIPRLTIHVFGETDAFEQCWTKTAADRRLSRTTSSFQRGGFVAALKHYVTTTTPDLLIIETLAGVDILQYEVDSLAEVCDPGTRLIIVGHNNDIQLYRKLLSLGVSNYIVFPVSITTIIDSISQVYSEPGTEKIGRSFAFIGAKGGVGASVLAQNVAYELARGSDADVLLADLDIPFGTSSLNLDVEPNQGLVELLGRPDLIGAETIDRVLVRRGMHLNLLGAVPGLEVEHQIDPDALETLLDVAQQHVPLVVLDLPHQWSAWVQRVLATADRIVVATTPEVSSLRNAAAIFERVAQLRPNDQKPLLALTQVGMPRRDEITAAEIASTLKITSAVSVPYDPRLFSEAAGRGKMLSEVAPRRPASVACRDLAGVLSARRSATVRAAPAGLFKLWKR